MAEPVNWAEMTPKEAREWVEQATWQEKLDLLLEIRGEELEDYSKSELRQELWDCLVEGNIGYQHFTDIQLKAELLEGTADEDTESIDEDAVDGRIGKSCGVCGEAYPCRGVLQGTHAFRIG